MAHAGMVLICSEIKPIKLFPDSESSNYRLDKVLNFHLKFLDGCASLFVCLAYNNANISIHLKKLIFTRDTHYSNLTFIVIIFYFQPQQTYRTTYVKVISCQLPSLFALEQLHPLLQLTQFWTLVVLRQIIAQYLILLHPSHPFFLSKHATLRHFHLYVK